MRIGILGGTFNPIHYGHLRAAEEVYEKFTLDIVYFIPCNKPPHKTQQDLIPPEERLKMINLAIKGNGRFKCSDTEIKRGGKSYSVDTIREFINNGISGNDLYFILGSDAFSDIQTWKNFREIFNLCNIIIIQRPGTKKENIKNSLPLDVVKKLRYNKKDKCYVTETKKHIYFTEITGLDISSTMIRNLIKMGRSVRYLVPDSVLNYIKKNRIFIRGK